MLDLLPRKSTYNWGEASGASRGRPGRAARVVALLSEARNLDDVSLPFLHIERICRSGR